MTVLDRVSDYRLTRDAVSLETPDVKTIPLPTATEQRKGNVQAIQQRAHVEVQCPTPAAEDLLPGDESQRR